MAIEDAVFDSDFIASIKAKVIAEQKAQEEFNLMPGGQPMLVELMEVQSRRLHSSSETPTETWKI